MDNGGASITSYNIYRSLTSGSEVYLTTIGNILQFTDASVVDDQVYFYQVTAVNAIGESAPSNEASAITPSVPDPPINVVANPAPGEISLSWTAPVSDGGAPITNYCIYRGLTSGGAAYLTTIGNVLQFTDNSVVNSQTYFYLVSAANAVGEGAPSSEASATTPSVPDPPTAPIASPTTGQITLTWVAPIDDGGAPIVGYNIYRGSTQTNLIPLTAVGNVFTYKDTEVINGEEYYYSVSAYNAVGEGSQSVPIMASPQAHPNKPPLAAITYPYPGSIVSDTIEIAGIALDADGNVQKVQVRIDNGPWLHAYGTNTWSYVFDTTGIANGKHTIQARSYDGSNYSSVTSVDFEVNNHSSEKSIFNDIGFWISFFILLLYFLIIIFLLMILIRKMRDEKSKYKHKRTKE
jgi:hypothetical protein